MEDSEVYVGHENVCDSPYLWLSSLFYLKGGFTCHFISSIHTLWFTVIHHSLQLLWNDSLPYKSLSHKLKHFYPIYPYVLVCIFPYLTQLHVPCISSHRQVLQTLPMQDLLVKSLISCTLTALVRKYYISSDRNQTPTQSILKRTLFAPTTRKSRQGYCWGQVNRDLDTTTTLSPSALLLCLWISFSPPAKWLCVMQGTWRRSFYCYIFTGLPTEKKQIFNLQPEWKIMPWVLVGSHAHPGHEGMGHCTKKKDQLETHR